MITEALLERIITMENPTREIGRFVVENFSKVLSSPDLSYYSEFEEKVSLFEQWLYETWGREFYQLLMPQHKEEVSINKAFQKAAEANANVLIADGFSIRELILLINELGKERIVYEFSYAAPPTITSKAAMMAFGTPIMKEHFNNKELIMAGKPWKTRLIENPANPPRIGHETGFAFYSYYPDAPLHNAQIHHTTLQDINEVIGKLITIIQSLSRHADLVITGDHGYLFLGDNPNLYLWKHTKSPRFGENLIIPPYETVGNYKVAIGRFHAVKSRDSFITHGGISLMESLIPVVIVRRESHDKL
ncbi:hypothetical protein [Thermococcus sp.]|uniref:hypothetical protein n=1 Tax=Thermococcus sp. TaxID=35749 RepID=UPI002611C1D2|nr:hypothetical protein [Thermococcus sp.]